MKKLFLFSLITICITSAIAQGIGVSKKAQEQFQKKYVGAADVKWTNNVSNATVTFKSDGVSCKGHYNISGEWNYTEKFIDSASIAEKAKDSFSKSKYRDWEVKSVAYVEYPKGESLYRYEVKKGISKNYVFFDKLGVLVKTNTIL